MHVLCLDSGSSSLKHALYDMPAETLVGSGLLEVRGAEAAAALADIIGAARTSGLPIDAVGHRIVFGGPRLCAPQMIDDRLVVELSAFEPLDPLHMPVQLALVQRARELLPSVQHVACFDTAFFHSMPEVARRYPLPASVDPLVRRYGFHGLSYEYIVSTGAARSRCVVAHLGSGASMAAIRDGKPLDTTMGFSPLGGLMMGTRPGDLDPGVFLYVIRQTRTLDVDAVARMLNEQSGLLGVSEASADMRELIARSPADDKAKNAIELFVYLAVKHASALVAVCGGLDTLIFTGGIGERAPSIRQRICAGLTHLGVAVDESLNRRSADRISSGQSKVDVLVIPTNEGIVLARHTHGLVSHSL